MILKFVLQILAVAYLWVSHSLVAAFTLSTGEDVADFVDAMIEQNQVSAILATSEVCC